MCDPTLLMAISGGVKVAAGGAEAYSMIEQGKADKKVSEYNATQLVNQATQVKTAGVEAENALRSEAAAKTSRQTAQLAAGGVDVGSSGARDITQSSALEAEADAMRIRRNTDAQVNAIRQEAELTLLTGRNAKKMAVARGAVSLLNNAAQGASSFAGASA